METKTDRNQLLDVLRGFALIGIFLGNVWFLGGLRLKPEFESLELYRWIEIFVDGKFHTLFSVLFGASYFYFIKTKHVLRWKRMMWLAPISAFHSFAIWWGDIVLLYALLGFLFIWTVDRGLSNKQLLLLSTVLWVSPDLIKLIFGALGPVFDGTYTSYDGTAITEVIQSGGVFEIWKMNWNVNAWKWLSYYLDSGRFQKVLGLFLIGFLAAKNGFFEKRQKAVYLIIVGAIGLAINTVGSQYLIIKYIGHLLLVAGYVEIIRMVQDKLLFLVPYGQMAFTNYVGQSVLTILICYNIGFGLLDRFSLASFTLMALSVLLMQILFSTIWSKKIGKGPIEMLWRRLYT